MNARCLRFGLGALCALGIAGLVTSAPGFAQIPGAVQDVQHLRGTVRSPEHPEAHGVDVYRIDGVDYLELDEVARVFRCTMYWRAELEKMVLKIAEHRVRLTVGSPFVHVDSRSVHLLAPVRWYAGRIVVPVALATEVLDGLVPERVTWDRAALTLRVDTGEPNVRSVEYDVRMNGTVVVVRASTELRGELEFPRPDRVVLRIPGGVLSEALIGGFPGKGLLDSLRTRQEAGAAVLTFHLGPLGGTAELLHRSSPPRLLVAVSEGLPDDIPLPEFAPPQAAGEGEAREVRRIVLDPGHGGSDTGAMAANGLTEKEANLSIAWALKRLLEMEEGTEVRLTREGDRFLANEERAEFANAFDADLYISIHCNGWFDSGLRGFSVGALPPPRAGAADEGTEMSRWGQRSRRTVRETELLAEMILEEMENELALPNRGLLYADYAALAGATMPAVLIECGFLTNSQEAALLSDPGFHEGLASVIVFAVMRYRVALDTGGEEAP